MGNIYNANVNPVKQNRGNRELTHSYAELEQKADVARNEWEISQPSISQARDNFLTIKVDKLSDDKAREEWRRRQP